ncbi:MAG: Signal transduction histidine-protein kinase AtoS [Candidatus Marinimicrobia bacterium]|nr:Signal transduction histidine-protein kinase AtoS [Candidatus Neomarinimicrobiota bacterium]
MASSFNDQHLLALLDLHDNLSRMTSCLSELLGDDKAKQSVIYWLRSDGDFHRLFPDESALPEIIDAKQFQDVFDGYENLRVDDVTEGLFGDSVPESNKLIPLYHGQDLYGLWIIPDLASVPDSDFQTAAKYLSIGLEHGQLIRESERQNRRLVSLVEAGEIFTSQTSLDDVLQKLVEELHGRFGYSSVAVLVLEGKNLRIAAAEGFYEDIIGYTFNVNKGITGRAARHGEDQLAGDVAEDEAYIDAGAKDIQSEMAVPIRMGEEVLGVLDAQSTQLHAFDESDVNFLHVVARQAAVAIHNAKLFEHLESTRDYLDKLLDSSGDAIFAITKGGEITTWNSGAERIYGYTTEEALGKSVDDLVDPDEHSRSADDVIKLVQENDGIYQEDEVIRKRKNGETFPTTATYTLLRDETGIIGLSIIEKDLTYLKQATKLDAAKTLISTVTHYINNAVTPLNGRAQIAEMQPTDENIETLIEVSLETTEKIQEVINTISEMKEFITTPYYNTSYIINLEEQLKEKLAEIKSE